MSEASPPSEPLSADVVSELLGNGHGQYKWYDAEALKAERLLTQTTWAGMIIGLMTSALAAFPSALLKEYGSGTVEVTRWVIAVGTLLVTLFSGTLASRYRKRASEREKGRIATALAINLAKVKLTHVGMTPAERGRLLDQFERELIRIEADYGTYDGRGEAAA